MNNKIFFFLGKWTPKIKLLLGIFIIARFRWVTENCLGVIDGARKFFLWIEFNFVKSRRCLNDGAVEMKLYETYPPGLINFLLRWLDDGVSKVRGWLDQKFILRMTRFMKTLCLPQFGHRCQFIFMQQTCYCDASFPARWFLCEKLSTFVFIIQVIYFW